ncbi:TPA: hypothetical protein ACGO44_000033 [Streptococcus suis]
MNRIEAVNHMHNLKHQSSTSIILKSPRKYNDLAISTPTAQVAYRNAC